MNLRDFLLDPVFKWALSIAAVVAIVGAIALIGIQMWRGDAPVCADGSIFAATCEAEDLPDSAVIAFDHDGCPPDWTHHPEARGRFIVGTGRHTEHDEYGNTVEDKGLRDTGGKYQVKLEIDHLPSHDHQNPSRGHSGSAEKVYALQAVEKGEYGGTHARPTAKTGNGKSHENMPPYIAFHLCTRSGT